MLNQVNPRIYGRAFFLGSKLDLHEAALDRITDEAGRFVDIELLHQPGTVRLRGLHADTEK